MPAIPLPAGSIGVGFIGSPPKVSGIKANSPLRGKLEVGSIVEKLVFGNGGKCFPKTAKSLRLGFEISEDDSNRVLHVMIPNNYRGPDNTNSRLVQRRSVSRVKMHKTDSEKSEDSRMTDQSSEMTNQSSEMTNQSSQISAEPVDLSAIHGQLDGLRDKGRDKNRGLNVEEIKRKQMKDELLGDDDEDEEDIERYIQGMANQAEYNKSSDFYKLQLDVVGVVQVLAQKEKRGKHHKQAQETAKLIKGWRHNAVKKVARPQVNAVKTDQTLQEAVRKAFHGRPEFQSYLDEFNVMIADTAKFDDEKMLEILLKYHFASPQKIETKMEDLNPDDIGALRALWDMAEEENIKPLEHFKSPIWDLIGKGGQMGKSKSEPAPSTSRAKPAGPSGKKRSSVS